MRRTVLVLIINLVWLAALAAGGAGLLLIPGWPGVVLAGIVAAAAFCGGLLVSLASDRRVAQKLAALGQAVGAAGGRDLNTGISFEAIIANLAGRLERASQVKGAFAGLEQPALLVSAEGEILSVSRGLSALEPRAVEGASITVLLGEAWAAGGMAEEELVCVGARRFAAHHRPAGAGRRVIELRPAGAYIADDDLDAFASALAGGHTGFRFDAEALATSPALRQLGASLESLDLGVEGLKRLADGEPLSVAGRRANSGIAPQVRDLADLIAALTDERNEAAEARAGLERKCEAILNAIDKYRTSIATMAETANAAKTGLEVAQQAVGRGRETLEAARTLSRDARAAVSEANLAAERAALAAGGAEVTAGEIDKLVAAIEDVSFRTNLLALNAAVEAARAGEKGAGFGVVADEVRMLSQLAQKTSRELRGLVGSNREQSQNGAFEAGALRNILSGLTSHLENLSNDTDRIAGALDEGSGAISRLDVHVSSLGAAAGRALTLPARRSQGGLKQAMLDPNEFALGEREFELIRTRLYEIAGISLSDAKRTLVIARLSKVIRGLGLPSFAAYIDYLDHQANPDEQQAFVNALTTNLTRFWREEHHFTHLVEQVGQLIASRASKRLRIWSAGCSTGQEPYTIALSLIAAWPELRRWDFKILATDIDTAVIAKAATGIYPDSELNGLAAERARLFETLPGGRIRIPPALQALVSFKPLNLMAPWPMKGPFDAIFCRNVAIYFDKPTQAEVFGRLGRILSPGGFLYIGHSENLGAGGGTFKLVGKTIYQARAAEQRARSAA